MKDSLVNNEDMVLVKAPICSFKKRGLNDRFNDLEFLDAERRISEVPDIYLSGLNRKGTDDDAMGNETFH